MPIIPSPQLQVPALAQLLTKRHLLWHNDFLSWPSVPTALPGMGLYSAVAAMADNGEGGWASVVNGSIECAGEVVTGFIVGSRNPRGVWRATFAAANAQITKQQIGFSDALGGSINPSLNRSAYLRQVTTGNVFFVTCNAAGSETTTDLGALTGPFEWEISSLDGGVSWQCYKDGVLVASHNTSVPTGVGGLGAGVHLTRTAGAHALLLDWTWGDCDLST